MTKIWISALGVAALAGCDQIPLPPATELEGTVQSDDCRAHILTQQGAPETQGKKFICSYMRSDSGKIMGGICAAVETEGKVCQRSYTYSKEPWAKCPEHSGLQRNDTCQLDVGFRWSHSDHTQAEAIRCPEH